MFQNVDLSVFEMRRLRRTVSDVPEEVYRHSKRRK